MTDRNTFGGKNARSAYVPMSETEQEFVSRLIESGDLMVVIHEWGVYENLKVTLGDAQMMIPLSLSFDRPAVPIPVYFFDLELRTRSGITLFREKQPTVYGGQPIGVGAGTEISMVWHIGIQCIDPKLVKMLMPGATGLTSRVLDKDTGQVTHLGNMSLSADQRRLLAAVRQGEGKVRADKAQTLKRNR
jgi:hypothetical protein